MCHKINRWSIGWFSELRCQRHRGFIGLAFTASRRKILARKEKPRNLLVMLHARDHYARRSANSRAIIASRAEDWVLAPDLIISPTNRVVRWVLVREIQGEREVTIDKGDFWKLQRSTPTPTCDVIRRRVGIARTHKVERATLTTIGRCRS